MEAFRCSRFGASIAAEAAERTSPTTVPAGSGVTLATGQSEEAEDMARICFEEFVEVIGRLALKAYNYQVVEYPLAVPYSCL